MSTEATGDPYRHRIPAAFDRLTALPALRESRNRLLRVLLTVDHSVDDLIDAIETDVALVIAVLRAANEKGKKISTVPDAITRLNPAGVEELAKQIAVVDFFERMPGWDVPLDPIRNHAVAVQRAAAVVADRLQREDGNEIRVSALLHDVGKLLLIDVHHGYPENFMGDARTPEERLQAERRALGLDHAVIGGVLARRWRLPDSLASAIERHHSATDGNEAATVIRLADMLTLYAQGQPTDTKAMTEVASALGFSESDLRSLLFDVGGDHAPTKPRRVQKSPLSTKQRDALRGLATGKTYGEIAFDLGLSPSTIRSHVHAVYSKLGVTDRAQAVLTASEHGWI
jgi:putative nucleotidyltransferase with HDIG domain